MTKNDQILTCHNEMRGSGLFTWHLCSFEGFYYRTEVSFHPNCRPCPQDSLFSAQFNTPRFPTPHKHALLKPFPLKSTRNALSFQLFPTSHPPASLVFLRPSPLRTELWPCCRPQGSFGGRF